MPDASPPCFTCLYASHTISVVMGTLTPCLVNSSIIPCGCFVFNNFIILCTPSLLPAFNGYQHYYKYIRPCGWFVKAYYFLRMLRSKILPLCRLYVLAHLRTILPTGAYSTSTGSPVPAMRLSVSPGGFIPDAVNTSGNL
jgi:hypothetical protein